MKCRDCGEQKPDDAFPVLVDPLTGSRQRGRACRECRYPVHTTTLDPVTGLLRCSRCREWKDPELFCPAAPSRQGRPAIRARGGRDYYCRECKAAAVRDYYETHAADQVQRSRERRRRLGITWRGSGRPHGLRKYIPAPGDHVFVHGVNPPLKGRIAAVDPVAYTAKVRTSYGTLEYRWTDFRAVRW